MTKKLPLFAALCAASVCTVAGAQSVQIYGKLYPYLESESVSGNTAAGTSTSTLAPATITGIRSGGTVKGMSSGNSNIGFKGREDLGGGLYAIFQLEGTAAIDSGASGFSFNRDTFVGVTSKEFGEIKLGNMDTVFKTYGDTLGILGISSGTPVSSSNILRKTSFGTSNNARFHERRANSVRYDSPKFGDFEFGLTVATQEAPLTVGTAVGTGSAKTYAGGVKWDNGPFYVALAVERHENWYGGSSNARSTQSNVGTGIGSADTAVQFTAEWRITKTQTVEFDVITKKYKEGATVVGRFAEYKNNAYMVAYDGRFDAWRVMAHYVRSGAGTCTLVATACSTSGLQGSQLTGGAAYSITRRTYLFGAFSQISNGSAGRFNANDLNTSIVQGERSRHLIAGISHSF